MRRLARGNDAGERASECTASQQVQLAAEAVVEHRVEQRGHEREDEPHCLGEPRGTRVLQLARRAETRTYEPRVDESVRLRAEAHKRTQPEGDRLDDEKDQRPHTGAEDEYDREHDRRDRGAEPRTARVDRLRSDGGLWR